MPFHCSQADFLKGCFSSVQVRSGPGKGPFPWITTISPVVSRQGHPLATSLVVSFSKLAGGAKSQVGGPTSRLVRFGLRTSAIYSANNAHAYVVAVRLHSTRHLASPSLLQPSGFTPWSARSHRLRAESWWQNSSTP